MAEQNAPALKITIDDATSAGHYVNFANIMHNMTEFVLDFGRIMPGRPDVRIFSRILTTPIHAKQFLNALQENIRLYEQQFGAIPEAPGPVPREIEPAAN